MMPGERPVEMLAEHLARAFRRDNPELEMADVRRRLEDGDKRALADWLRGRKPDDHTAVLLAIDQFEELFTVADPDERRRLDCLLASALADPKCPLSVLSTVRSDFLDRYDELVPRLVDVRNRLSKLWTLPRISAQGLREIVTGPARLAGLDVSGVVELMAELHEEPGALPLVENALTWLWEQRTDDRLSGQLYIDQGGAAGILSRNADSLLEGLGDQQRERALELLLRLVNVDPEGRRHTRQRMSFAEAVEVAGGGGDGRRLVHHLAGHIVRAGGKPRDGLRLITITQDAAGGATVDRRGMLTP